MAPTFVTDPGDTPLRTVPADYCADGEGRWLVLADGPDAGRRLFFWQRPADPGMPTVLLVHGNPECSYTWRKVVAALPDAGLPAGSGVVAMDHLGFGRSDQATFEMVDVHHARNLGELVAALDLREVVLVVHDWGGPIGVGALLEEPARVAGLVVVNSTVFPIPGDPPTYDRWPVPVVFPWSRSARIVPDALWGAHAAFAVGATQTGAAGLLAGWAQTVARHRSGPIPGPDGDALALFRDQFATTANVRSSKRMVRQTPVWGHGYTYDDPRLGPQDNRAFYRRMQERITPAWGAGGRAVPAAGVFGAWDVVAKPSVLAQWRTALPQIEIDVLEGASHFVEEQRPEAVAAAIARVALAARGGPGRPGVPGG